MYKDRLKDIREDKGVNQEVVANYIGIHRGRYSQYETELDIFPIKHLNTCCNFFECTLDFIFGFTNVFNYNGRTGEIDKDKQKIRLKELRKNNGITQVELAEKLNVAKGTIAEYERGTNVISTACLYSICKEYKVSADYLLGIIDYDALKV